MFKYSRENIEQRLLQQQGKDVQVLVGNRRRSRHILRLKGYKQKKEVVIMTDVVHTHMFVAISNSLAIFPRLEHPRAAHNRNLYQLKKRK